MHIKNIIEAGNTINATKALIMIHGRGGTAEDILSISKYLNVEDYLLLGPQATGNSWYPNSFIADEKDNQPALDAALQLIHHSVDYAISKGISKENIYLLGFSQGACLTVEYLARNADKFGGGIALTGGLIGRVLNTGNYKGDFKDTPIFLGTSDPDFHVPVSRVNETDEILSGLGAKVIKKIYPDMGHTIIEDEINTVNTLIFK